MIWEMRIGFSKVDITRKEKISSFSESKKKLHLVKLTSTLEEKKIKIDFNSVDLQKKKIKFAEKVR